MSDSSEEVSFPDKIFIDTDILIDFSKKKGLFLQDLLNAQSRGRTVLHINPVVLAEFLTDDNLKKQKNLQKILQFLGLFTMIDISKEMGILAGEFLREKKLPYVADALIAATCIDKGLQLATRNRKHFSKIKKLAFCNITQ